jgi:hypothetical protein
VNNLFSKRIFFILFAGIIMASPSAGQSKVPTFKSYGVPSVYQGKTVPIKWNKETRVYRTRLKEAAKEKVNFAGHYILTYWGCGAECLSVSTIDAKTGAVGGLPFSVCCWSVRDDVKTIDFRDDSRLIVIRGLRNESEKDSPDDVHYYEYQNGRFKFIKTVKHAAK